jgi:hypothetical protein
LKLLYIHVVKIFIAQAIRIQYYSSMLISEYFIVFPEGDIQEIQGRLPFNALVDMNGNVLSPPLPTNKMIVFKVDGIKTEEKKGSSETYHFLELLSAEELLEYT